MCVDMIAGEWHGAGWGNNCPTSGVWRVGEVRVVARHVVGGKIHDELCSSSWVDVEICHFLVTEKLCQT